MSKQCPPWKATQRHSLTRARKRLGLYRRNLRYEPLEDRHLLAVVIVTTLGDTINFSDGVTSLREAIFATNTVPGADTINFAPSLTAGGPATLLLTQGELAIADSLTIAGPGANLLTIDAIGSDLTPTLLDGKGSRVFNIDDGTANLIDVSVSGLRLTGADSNDDGGAIFDRENLNLQHVTVEKNFSWRSAGAIAHVDGTLHLFDTLISQNSHQLASNSGVVTGSNGTVIIESSTFSGNSGSPALYNALSASNTNVMITGSTFSENVGLAVIRVTGGELNVENSRISDNSGGISSNNANVTIVDSMISNNNQTKDLGGIVATNGTLTINRTTISGNKTNQSNRGGGVTAISAVVSIVDSLISNNTAQYGAGIYMTDGQAEISHSTIENNLNTAVVLSKFGAGIHSSGTNLKVVDCTVSGNTGAGGYGVVAGGSASVPFLITDSTVAGNAGGIRVAMSGGSAIVSNVVVSGNTDSGIYVQLTNSAATTITNSTIVDNSAFQRGGGINLKMAANCTATVAESEISGNKVFGVGGGLYANGGILTIDKTDVHDNKKTNQSLSDGGGGVAIRLTATTITDSRVFNNSSQGVGGGISAIGPSLTVNQSEIFGNSARGGGGGIWSAAPLVVDNSRIANNTADSGGGFYANGSPLTMVSIAKTSIVGNSATGIPGNQINSGHGGGFLGIGTIHISDSTIDGNSAVGVAGGIGIISSTATIERTTISNNSAKRGGGVHGGGIGGSQLISESTITGNHAEIGAGVYTQSAKIDHTTIAFNQASNTGGGVYLTAGSLNLDHTIVAQNTGTATDIATAAGTTVSAKYSLVGMNSGSSLNEAPVGSPDGNGNLIGGTVHGMIDPLLGPLADNGGPTMTHALLAGSPAINNGDLSAVAGVNGVPLYDQRGTPFGRVFNGRIDIGAFEYQVANDLNLVVDTLVDESDGNYGHGELSLREAIALANLYSSKDTISFDPALTAAEPATIRLTNGELKITDSLTINGPGANLLTIDASGNDPTPSIKEANGSRVFNIDDGLPSLSMISLNGMTVTGADVKVDGGGIYTTESLVISDARVSGNYARPSGPGSAFSARGAGIYATGPLWIENAFILANYGTGYGAGIYAVENAAADITIKNSEFSGNKSNGNGGGIYIAQNGPGNITIQDCISYANDAGFSGFSGNGGGVYINRQGSGNVSILDSTFRLNNAYSYGTLYIYVGQSAAGNVSFEGTEFLENRSKVVGQPSMYVEHNAVGNIELSSDTFTGNNTFNSSGMNLIHRGTGDVRVENSYVTGVGRSDNHSRGTVTISHSGSGNVDLSGNQINDNLGRAAYIHHTGSGEVTIVGNEFARNDAGSFSAAGLLVRTGIAVPSRVTNNVVLNNKSTINLGNAGGIFLQGTDGGAFLVENNVIVGNSGGIFATVAGNLSVNGNVVTDNTGTGLSLRGLSGAVIQLRSNDVSRNVSSLRGGGIALRTNQGASVTIADSTISGNVGDTSGGGVDADQYVGSSLEILRTTIDGNRLNGNLTPNATTTGGGMRIFDRGGSVSLDQVTISGNRAARGGGVWISTVSADDVAIRRSTIVNNSATSAPSSPANGGGVFVQAGSVLLDHTLVAQNTDAAGGAPDAGRDAAATGIEVRYSLVGNNAGSGLLEAPVGAPDANGNLIGGSSYGAIDPLLGPLVYNGGLTRTHELLPESPAINAGDPTALAGISGVPLNDQRGVLFTRVYDGRIDIGAFELQPTDVPGDFNRDGVVDGADYPLFRKQMAQIVAPGTSADANGDGIVNNADYAIWKSNFGRMQTQLPRSAAAAPAVGLSKGAIFSAPQQPATFSQVSLSDNSILPTVAPQVMRWLNASQATLRSTKHLLRLPGASSDLAARTARFDYAIEAWSNLMDGSNKRQFLESDAGPFRFADCKQDGPESPASAGVVVDEAFASL